MLHVSESAIDYNTFYYYVSNASGATSIGNASKGSVRNDDCWNDVTYSIDTSIKNKFISVLHCYSKKYGGITDNRRPGDHDRNCLVLRHATLPSPSMQSVNRPSCERKIVLIHTDFSRKGASSIASTSISMMVYVKIGVETKGQVGRKEVWNKCRRVKPIWGRGRMAQLLNCLITTNQH